MFFDCSDQPCPTSGPLHHFMWTAFLLTYQFADVILKAVEYTMNHRIMNFIFNILILAFDMPKNVENCFGKGIILVKILEGQFSTCFLYFFRDFREATLKKTSRYFDFKFSFVPECLNPFPECSGGCRGSIGEGAASKKANFFLNIIFSFLFLKACQIRCHFLYRISTSTTFLFARRHELFDITCGQRIFKVLRRHRFI